MQNQKKSFRLTALLLCFVSVLNFMGCMPKEYSIKAKQSISNLSCLTMPLSENEKNTVNNYLKNIYYEDDSICGFTAMSRSEIDFYLVRNVLKIETLIGNVEQISTIRERLSFLPNISIEGNDLLNIIYYVEICELLGYSYNKDVIKKELYKYYIDDEAMFYLNNVDDSLGIKCVISAMCYSICKEIIYEKYEEMCLSAWDYLGKFQFVTDNKIALFNAGGAILYYCATLGLDISTYITKNLNWFAYWEKLYESNEIESVESCTFYAEFLKIADLFTSKYSREKIDNFYSKVKNEDIEKIDDMQIIYTVLSSVDEGKNEGVINFIVKKIERIIENEELFTSEVSARSTAFAVALCFWSGFKYNVNKINNYISKEYDKLLKSDNLYNNANDLYYLVSIDQLVNGFSNAKYSTQKTQKIINSILDGLSFNDETITNDIEATRYVVEVISNAQVFDRKISINEQQVDKIKKAIKKSLEEEHIKQSILIIDLAFVDMILGLNMVDISIISSVYNKLSCNKGLRVYSSEDIAPDLYTTFCFRKLAEFYPDIEENSMVFSDYSEVFKLKNGLYSIYEGSKESISSVSVYAGYYLKYAPDYNATK